MNIITMPQEKDHAKQVLQTAIMIKRGSMAISDWLKGEVNFLSRILRRGQQFEVHFMSDPLPKVVLCKVILWLCVKLILIITRYMRGDMK